nr:PREDICTED: NSFL1 cofactor p47-like [Bemisia tabaci]
MSNHDELISQFANIASVETERAKFYLEAADWKLEVALASFYENCGSDSPDIVEVENDASSDSASAPPPVPAKASSDPAPSSSAAEPKKKPKPSSSSRIATLASFKDKEENSDEDEGQAFYAGGSEHSGQQVIGPGKKKKDFVYEMFKSVQEQGAEIVDASNPVSRSSAFEGTGYRLGATSNDTEVVNSSSSTSRQSSAVAITLKLWREGFSIDDGPIREYTNPENQDFLDAIKRGEVPQELVRNARGGEFHLNMEDHRFEDYVAPKPKVKAFAGEGHVLGNPSPAVVGTTKVLDEKDRLANENQAKQTIPVDESSPTTSIQIRLADGTRLVARLNHSHTVGDVRRYITVARPHYEIQNFTLMTTFPSKELSDPSQTIAEAGILNASLLQRLT